MTNDYKIYSLLSDYLNTIDIDIQPVNGGDINEAYKVILSDQTLFLKVNLKELTGDMFDKEKMALEQMKGIIQHVPTPKQVLSNPSFSCLLMSYIPPGNRMGINGQINLAKCLASLHSCKHSHFGYEYDNYIGRLPQSNNWKDNWIEFYIQNRLEPQVRLAYNDGLLSNHDIQQFKSLYLHLEGILDAELESSLLHGDLWGGNYIIDTEDQAWLIDPAIYFGNREVDIAMTRLFGGFSDDFYDTYQSVYPLKAGHEERIPFYQLYYLLVHLNLFGSTYYDSVKRIVNF